MKSFDAILNWEILEGSHEFPGPDGGTCVNEAAIVAAGLPYRMIESAYDMPPCFSRVLSQYALTLNDAMPHGVRQRLLPYVWKLNGTADSPDIEQRRAEYLAMGAVTVIAANALDAAGLWDHARACRNSRDLKEAARAATAAKSAAVICTATSAWSTAYSTAEWAELAAAKASSLVNRAWNAAKAAVAAEAWDDALALLDGALAIGKQAPPVEPEVLIQRLEAAKALAAA